MEGRCGQLDGAAAITAMRRLINADAAQCDTTEPGWAERVAAFEEAGHPLARLAARIARRSRTAGLSRVFIGTVRDTVCAVAKIITLR